MLSINGVLHLLSMLYIFSFTYTIISFFNCTLQEPIETIGLGGVQLVYKNLSFGESSTHFLTHDDLSGSVSASKDTPSSKELIVLYDRNVHLMKSFFEDDLPPDLVHPADDSGSTEAIMEQYMDLSAPSSPPTTISEEDLDVSKLPIKFPTPRLFDVGPFNGTNSLWCKGVLY